MKPNARYSDWLCLDHTTCILVMSPEVSIRFWVASSKPKPSRTQVNRTDEKGIRQLTKHIGGLESQAWSYREEWSPKSHCQSYLVKQSLKLPKNTKLNTMTCTSAPRNSILGPPPSPLVLLPLLPCRFSLVATATTNHCQRQASSLILLLLLMQPANQKLFSMTSSPLHH